MELLKLMKYRRSIRKYQDRQISREDMETVIEAGTYAPNAGGGQRSIIIGVRNAELAEKIGAALFREWNIPENYIACCFVLLGYCEGEYPKGKLRKRNRGRIKEPPMDAKEKPGRNII